MNLNNQTIETDEIDLGKIIRKLWKDKFLILSVSLIFSLLSYLHISQKPKEFQTTITLREIPSTLLNKFDSEIKFSQQQSLKEIKPIVFANSLNKEFNQNLNSFDNLNRFVKNNNKFSSFKAFLKEKKISAKDYFLNGNSKNKFGNIEKKNKSIENKYYLNFPKELEGDDFLNDYVLFIFKESEKAILQQIRSMLSIQMSRYEKDLAITKKLNIKEPILQQKLQERSILVINESDEGYYKGATVIQSKIDSLNKIFKDAKKYRSDFNPILDQASKPINISDSPLKFGILGFIAGSILSLIYIIVRNVLKSS
jgi:LPS O-antigen subunit length determinant protein (WzzB/FepE family)